MNLKYLWEMIIRRDVLKMLKASSLNSRSVRRTCGEIVTAESTLKECPNKRSWATLSRVWVTIPPLAGVLAPFHYASVSCRRRASLRFTTCLDDWCSPSDDWCSPSDDWCSPSDDWCSPSDDWCSPSSSFQAFGLTCET